MSLLFCETQSQAILALVIKTANEMGKNLGRTAVQKILYFLGVRDVKTKYRFDIYHYGPFCEQILWDLDLLIADGVIEDRSPKSGYSAYVSGDHIDELINLHRESIATIENTVKEVTKTLAPLKPVELELIATLDYVYRQQLATGVSNDLKRRVVERFQEVKKDKFSPEIVSATYDSMVKAHFLSA